MSDATNKAVFLSYASQDAKAVRRICDALRAAGVEVWFDQSELRGGDAWDAKIRRQIRDCALFVPVISATTQARREGYFRLEWRLADQRTHLMGRSGAFIVPVCIDATPDRDADVPDSFQAVQWTRLPGGVVTPAFTEQVKLLLAIGEPQVTVPPFYGTNPAQDGQPATTAIAVPPTKSPGRNRSHLNFAVGLLAIVFVAVWQPWKKPESAAIRDNSALNAQPRTPTTKSTTNLNSVAVLPFANLSGDKEQEYFSDGLTEEILNALAREPSLRVVPRTSAFSFRERKASLVDIARALNVGRIVEGSVQRVGNRVRIRVTLTRVADEASEALDNIDRELSDIFALQDEVARKVLEKITGRTSTRAMPVLTRNPDAYDAYLKGRSWQTREGSSEKAIPFFKKAVDLDPDFAMAWARLAEATFRGYLSNDRSSERVKQTSSAVARALALNPALPEALIVRATVARDADYNFIAAERDLQEVEKISPGSAELRWERALLAMDRGDWERAIRLMRESLDLEPQQVDWTGRSAIRLAARGMFAEADRLYRRAEIIKGTDRDTGTLQLKWRGPGTTLSLLKPLEDRRVSGRVSYARLLALLGRGDESRSLAKGVIEEPDFQEASLYTQTVALDLLGPGETARVIAENIRRQAETELARGNQFLWTWNALVRAQIVLGQPAAALKTLTAWRHSAERRPSDFWQYFDYRSVDMAPRCYALLGRADDAVQLLQENWKRGYREAGFQLRHDPAYASIRHDARFQELMQQAEAWAKAQPHPIDP